MKRPARPDEQPRYGSVWQYAGYETRYMAVAPGPRTALGGQEWVFVTLSPSRTVLTSDGFPMIWRSKTKVLEDWACIDEGPDA